MFLNEEGEKDKEDGRDWVRKSSTSSIINIMSTMIMVMVFELCIYVVQRQEGLNGLEFDKWEKNSGCFDSKQVNQIKQTVCLTITSHSSFSPEKFISLHLLSLSLMGARGPNV